MKETGALIAILKPLHSRFLYQNMDYYLRTSLYFFTEECSSSDKNWELKATIEHWVPAISASTLFFLQKIFPKTSVLNLRVADLIWEMISKIGPVVISQTSFTTLWNLDAWSIRCLKPKGSIRHGRGIPMISEKKSIMIRVYLQQVMDISFRKQHSELVNALSSLTNIEIQLNCFFIYIKTWVK